MATTRLDSPRCSSLWRRVMVLKQQVMIASLSVLRRSLCASRGLRRSMLATVSPLMRMKSDRMTCLWSISRSASPALMQLVLTMV